VASIVRASTTGFPVPLLSTTTMPIISPKATLGSSAVGAVSLCCCSVVCWLVVPLDPARSYVARLLSPTDGGWLPVGCFTSFVDSSLISYCFRTIARGYKITYNSERLNAALNG
jgi:hypothetical protein